MLNWAQNEYSNQKQTKELLMYRKYHMYVFQVGTLCSGSFRSKSFAVIVSTRMKLKFRVNNPSKKQEQEKSYYSYCRLGREDNGADCRSNQEKEWEITRQKILQKTNLFKSKHKSWLCLSLHSQELKEFLKNSRKRLSRETSSSIAFINTDLECFMPARYTSQACHYVKMNCRGKRKEKKKEKAGLKK